ncbi:MAG: endolytic transglycosylase MltG [Clostridia bacterium]|nr:endolytic transglycosylase MltG [Clostridia bacterium]
MRNRYRPMFTTKRRHYKRNIVLCILLALVIFAGYVTLSDVYALGRRDGGAVSVYLPENANSGDVSKILKENGAVKFPLFFRLYAQIKGEETVSGALAVECSLTYKELLDAVSLKNNENITTFLVEKGSTVKDIEDMALAVMNITPKQFRDAMANYKWDKNYIASPSYATKYQGYFYPGKYTFQKGVTADTLVSTMVSEFGETLGENLEKASKNTGFTVNEIITIASIVEKECSSYEEMVNKVTEIKENLKAEKPLCVESALKYALGKETLEEADKKISSPYNTFINKGLPKGPICNPSVDAIKAVTEAQ